MKTTNYKYEIFMGGNRAKGKYNNNILYTALNRNFMKCVLDCLKLTGKKEVLEIGCGEGQIMGIMYANGYHVSGIDIAEEAVQITKSNFESIGIMDINVNVGSIYDRYTCQQGRMIFCCEVLEHLEEPEAALKNILNATDEYLLVSVPREPIWCMLNMVRGKYWKHWGNTPGHINHWSKRKFMNLCRKYGTIEKVMSPLPWTMVLIRKTKENL